MFSDDKAALLTAQTEADNWANAALNSSNAVLKAQEISDRSVIKSTLDFEAADQAKAHADLLNEKFKQLSAYDSIANSLMTASEKRKE